MSLVGIGGLCVHGLAQLVCVKCQAAIHREARKNKGGAE